MHFTTKHTVNETRYTFIVTKSDLEGVPFKKAEVEKLKQLNNTKKCSAAIEAMLLVARTIERRRKVEVTRGKKERTVRFLGRLREKYFRRRRKGRAIL